MTEPMTWGHWTAFHQMFGVAPGTNPYLDAQWEHEEERMIWNILGPQSLSNAVDKGTADGR